VFYAPLDAIFSNIDVVEPDLLCVSKGRAASVLAGQHVHGTPELVIEIASKGTRRRDETIKRRLYERAGVSEYWTVDPELEVVRVYRRETAGFARPNEWSCEAGDVLDTPLLPGFTLRLRDIFRG
jgi:Uma2 family endonuclease